MKEVSSIFSGLSIFIGKTMIILMRRLGRNATTLPGKIALRLDKRLPSILTRNQNVTLITGTNGKTTTARILCSIYTACGYLVISNVSGANLISGITTTLIESRSWHQLFSHKKNEKIRYVIEIDEAAFGRYAASLNPSVIVVTNLFRDQLDRFGELSKTRELIRKGIRESVNARVLLCADDSLCASLAVGDFRERTVFFGVENSSMQKDAPNKSAATEAGNCVFCGAAYRYSYRSFGHLGYYACPQCGYSRPETNLHCEYRPEPNNQYRAAFWWSDPQRFNQKNSDKMEMVLSIPGEHNVYNTMAAIGAACLNGILLPDTGMGISQTKAGFGRMERFRTRDRDTCIVLVKNPVGLERALDFLANATDAGGVLLLLNDNIADGTDVSWIWDVDFESKKFPDRCFVSGTRCYDMALRLQYAGIEKSQITVSPDFSTLFETALTECEPGKCLYVLPNYTSLLELRAYLSETYKLKEIWK